MGRFVVRTGSGSNPMPDAEARPDGNAKPASSIEKVITAVASTVSICESRACSRRSSLIFSRYRRLFVCRIRWVCWRFSIVTRLSTSQLLRLQRSAWTPLFMNFCEKACRAGLCGRKLGVIHIAGVSNRVGHWGMPSPLMASHGDCLGMSVRKPCGQRRGTRKDIAPQRTSMSHATMFACVT